MTETLAERRKRKDRENVAHAQSRGNDICFICHAEVPKTGHVCPERKQKCACGNIFKGFGEACPDCRSKCICRWDLGVGPNLNCPLHGRKQQPFVRSRC